MDAIYGNSPASHYLKMFEKIFKTPGNFWPGLNQGSGWSYRLDLILDCHQTDVFGSERGSFAMSLSSVFDIVDVTSQPIRINPGFGRHTSDTLKV